MKMNQIEIEIFINNKKLVIFHSEKEYFDKQSIFINMGKTETRGGKREGAGRKKGKPNKATTETREAFKVLVESNTNKFQGWLDKIAETNPAKAFELITNLAEYVLPKLSRTELTGDLEIKSDVNVSKYSEEDLRAISDIRKKNESKYESSNIITINNTNNTIV